MRHQVRSILWPGLLLAAAVTIAACEIDVQSAVGKECQTANDCPRDLVCVAAGRIPPGAFQPVKTCEALAVPPIGNFEPEDAGVAFWCTDVQPLMELHCLACHGVPPAGGAPATFQLAEYEANDAGIPGARTQAERIYFRTVVTRDMPPTYVLPEEDQRTITAWYFSGAPFCPGDGGMGADGGADTDAGM